MKIIVSLLLAAGVALGTTSCCSMRTQVVDGLHASSTFHWKSTRRGELPYLLHLPRGYSPHAGKPWPLLLFLHGAGERGTNVQRAGIHGPMSLVRRGTNLPFVIVAPLCPAGERWQNDSLSLLLDHVTKKYHVDRKRVYLTGLSMGGYGTWSLGVTQPERFAAIAPICGGGTRIDLILGGRDKAAALKSLPIWAFHGAKDKVVPLDESERMVAALKNIGVKDIKLTVYPDADHDSWTETYKNPEFYEWLLKQKR
jgi:predicted peptidase